MPPDETERKLAAILSADVVGYSRLMSEDEAATIRSVRDHREAIELLVRQQRGRVVDSPGDNILAEFRTALEAVRCAVEIQAFLGARNASLPRERRMEFRIGVHMGDIAVDGERIYGDGVNIAARLEGLAEAGGICISATVHEQVRNKLEVGFVDLGDQTVKNVPDQVRVYRVQPKTAEADAGNTRARRPLRRLVVAAAALAVLVVAGLWASWPRPLGLVLDFAGITQPPVAPPLPAKPSIVVLPFSNLSGDPDQEWFSDGITEELTADLATSPELFVIARNSAFSYKGRPVPISDVGRELGVRYVLEGSVRRVGARARIAAQLIDATSGHHLWSEQYDRELQDVFGVQSEISEAILAAVGVEVREAEIARIRRRPTDDLSAYESYARAMIAYYRFTRAGVAEARALLRRAIELDPDYADAHSLLGGLYVAEYTFGWSSDASLLDRAREQVDRTRELDSDHVGIYIVLTSIALNSGRPEEALRHAERAIEQAPSLAAPHTFRAVALGSLGRPVEALESLRTGMRLEPRLDEHSALGNVLAFLQYQTGREGEAVARWERGRRANADLVFPRLGLIHAHLAADRLEPARAIAAEIRRVAPDLTAERAAQIGGRLLGIGRDEQPALERELARAGLPLDGAEAELGLTVPGFSGRPAIAVLPFDNLSADPDQAYVADGIVEDLITRLSRVGGLPVIARNSTFTYKGRAVDVTVVSRELGVRYVVEGSVRRAGSRIRVTAQLVDATTGHHVWAERYDRELRDVFALQDEITEKIVGAITPELRRSETERAAHRDPASLDAWESYHRGWTHFYRLTEEGNARARALFERATELDPQFAEPWAAIARTHQWDLLFAWSESPERSAAEASRAARRCVALDDASAGCQVSLGWSHFVNGETEEALGSLELAVRLDPSSSAAHYNLGLQLAFAGRPDEGISQIEQATRLSPRSPESWIVYSSMAAAHLVAGRYEQAVDWARRSTGLRPDFGFSQSLLAASLGHLGHLDEARAALAEAQRLQNGTSVTDALMPASPAINEQIRDGLRRAGGES